MTNGSVVARDHVAASVRIRASDVAEVAVRLEAARGTGAVSAGLGDPDDFR
jgi:hypothetical protein